MLNKIIAEESIQKAKKMTDKYDKIVIVTHISPDGDAIGSSLALYHFLLESGKMANVIVPNEFPGFLQWMDGAADIIIEEKSPEITKETIEAAELIFCLDFNTLKRIGRLEDMVKNSSAKKILIDHHPYPEKFCDVTISHPEISSTSELIFRFICRMGRYEDVNKSCAECIYTGMMTDTGAFTYNSNNPAIYYIISELLTKGIDKDAIYSKVYNNYLKDRIRLEGFMLYRKMKLYEAYKTALMTLSLEEHLKFNPQKGDTEGFVNIPLSIDKIVFSAFLREEKDLVRISLRSRGNFPSNQFAKEIFNGGGHLNASGGEFQGSLEEAVKLFEEALPRYKHLLI
ncbi:MAG: bifunctional oligoribonuclease/PAP phosphatase NrnA [Dysgonamonadaceae bacterium]|jgi:phosphoesterase RecJ-like protein|nr:bifunctional oligoribonuclease/PAP phosphatase NrnA [Dysgonamonadaceae bacterium]